MIQVREVRKSYGEIRAVDGVTFEVRSGETFGLLGPNGAGKTTLIHMMAGAIAPDGGEIHLDGRADPTRPEVRGRIGFAPQAQAIYDDLTGEENIAFFGTLYGLPKARLKERVAWALDFAGLTERRRDRSVTYSGGMQRRLNLACALVHDPPVLFLDEPTVGVDPQSRSHIFDNIEQLKQAGKTILYTTHYMEEAERLCDRIAIIDHGKILALDGLESLLCAHGGRSRIEGELEGEIPNGNPFAHAIEGRALRLESERPYEEVAKLAGSGLRFVELRVRRPNLETVFLELTGRTLRD
jgi:ABC-2 type transport system ATP-binding protein